MNICLQFGIASELGFVVCLSVCHFVLVFFSPFSIAITSLGEERANLSAFSTFVRFVLVWICRFPLPLGVWAGLRFVIVALPGLFSYFCFFLRFRVNKTALSHPVVFCFSTDRSKTQWVFVYAWVFSCVALC